MRQELLLRAIAEGAVGIIFLALLLLLLFALRKSGRGKKRGMAIFALAMLTLWCLMAFKEAYLNIRKMIVSQSTP
jgi:hypothetical protein